MRHLRSFEGFYSTQNLALSAKRVNSAIHAMGSTPNRGGAQRRPKANAIHHDIKILAILTPAIALLTGCSDAASNTTDGPTFVRDIEPLVQDRCVNCHASGGIAPFPLETFEQVQGAKDAIKAAVAARTMPPWLAEPGCNDYRGDYSLSDEQIDTVGRWADAGGPKGDPNDKPISITHDRLTLSRVDYTLPIPTPYTPKTFPDDYRCFFLDWPATETTYATGFGVEPGNESIVHHAVAYVVRSQNLNVFQALDDADPDPGWACFGGPGGDGPGTSSWLGGWAPGGNGEDFAAGTGIEVPVGAKIIVQVHYNSSNPSPEPDQTKVLVRVDPKVDKPAAILPFADIQWVLNGTMNIPAHSNDVTHSFSSDPSTFVKLATGGVLSGGKPLTIYSVGLHMHTLGRRIHTRLDHADGTSECQIDNPRWNFHWQRTYNFVKPEVAMPGDKLFLECQWDNPGDTDVNWGEGTSDEMCLAPYYLTE